MRKDMKKKLVDTHRVGGTVAYKGRKRKNPDVLEARRERIEVEEYEDEEGVTHIELAESVRHSARSGYRYRNTGDRKQFGENLNPLWRYLQKQVGRNWDTVYSEICEHMDRRSAVGGHIFEHLWGYVTPAKEVRIVDGVPHRDYPYLGGLDPITYSGKIGEWGCFYVDPRDNKLKRGVARGETKRQKQIRERKEDREDRLRQIGDDLWMSRHPKTELWFVLDCKKQQYVEEVVTFQQVSPDGQLVKDEYTKKTPVYKPMPFPEGLLVPEGMVVVSCRSASKKDILNIQ